MELSEAMNTCVEIDGKDFLINGRPTYEGREFAGRPVEGLLFNSRMIQAIFDDENDSARGLCGYQTMPVNWGVNTQIKRAFFARVAEITGSEAPCC